MNKKFQLLLTTTLTITEDKITNKEYPPLFEIAFLELSKGRRLLSGKKDLPLSKKDLWILFLTAKNKEVQKRMAEQNTTFQAAYDRLVTASSDEELRIQYFNREKALRDWNSSINAATRIGVSAPRDTVWLYYHISAILKTIKYCRKRPEAPHLFPGYSFGSILLEDFLPRASVLPAAPDDTGDPVPAYA